MADYMAYGFDEFGKVVCKNWHDDGGVGPNRRRGVWIYIEGREVCYDLSDINIPLPKFRALTVV